MRKYPLREYNLRVICKCYAMFFNIPYLFDANDVGGQFTDCYMTDYGLNWFYNFLRSKTIPFLKSVLPHLFSRIPADTTHLDYETCSVFNNFRGTVGVKRRAGTLQRAMVERRVKRCTRKYEFDSIAEARKQLMLWLRYYPADEFTLYRVREQRGYTVREQIPLVVDNGNRGRHLCRKDDIDG